MGPPYRLPCRGGLAGPGKLALQRRAPPGGEFEYDGVTSHPLEVMFVPVGKLNLYAGHPAARAAKRYDQWQDAQVRGHDTAPCAEGRPCGVSQWNKEGQASRRLTLYTGHPAVRYDRRQEAQVCRPGPAPCALGQF